MAAKNRNVKNTGFRKRKYDPDFKPDAKVSTWVKTSRLTLLQQQRLLKWLLYIGVIILALVTQDVVMSQLNLLGGTTDLPVAVILLITVLEGTEVGSLFVLIASVLYYFSGSAPGAYCIALISLLGIAAVMFRQLYWHRSQGSIVLCAGIALMCYELSLFGVGLFSELTLWSHFGNFVLTGLYSCATLPAFYPLIYKIGLIGGNTWKE
jgi:uncharacterized integral membrane protein